MSAALLRGLLLNPSAGRKALGSVRADLAKATGQKAFRDSLRKVRIKWRIPKGIRDDVEAVFRDLFGKSPRGTTWSALAERYPERFRDYVDRAQEDQEE